MKLFSSGMAVSVPETNPEEGQAGQSRGRCVYTY